MNRSFFTKGLSHSALVQLVPSYKIKREGYNMYWCQTFYCRSCQFWGTCFWFKCMDEWPGAIRGGDKGAILRVAGWCLETRHHGTYWAEAPGGDWPHVCYRGCRPATPRPVTSTSALFPMFLLFPITCDQLVVALVQVHIKMHLEVKRSLRTLKPF